MHKTKKISDVFKPYLAVKRSYKGGKAAPKGVTLHKLSSNENPLGSSPRIAEAIKSASQDLNIYPDNKDIRLREALAEYHNGELVKDQFVSANSGSEIIELLLRAFTVPGDEVILSNPCFLPYSMFTKWQGAKVVDVRLKSDDYALDIDGILNAITDKTRIIFLTSPNNPTGSIIPKGDLDKFLNEIPDDILIIFDEVYHHFADSDDFTTALPYVNEGKSIVAINSLSKAFGLASLRIGYCYSTEEIASYIRQIQRPFLLSKLSIEAAFAALKDKEFITQTVNLVHQEREYVTSEFDKLGIKYTPTQGNFILIDPPLPSPQMVEKLYQKGYMVRDVTNFGAPSKVRITFGIHEVNEGLIAAFKEILN